MIPAWIDDELRPMEKLEVHQRGLRHMAVSVFVTDGDFLLIQQRALCKYHTPGLWANTCCTHPHWEENAAVCAARRVREELGISGLAYAQRERIEYRADVGGGLTEHEVVDIFTADATRDVRIEPNPDEVMAYEWIRIEDLAAEIAGQPDKFTPWLRIYMTEHRDKIF